MRFGGVLETFPARHSKGVRLSWECKYKKTKTMEAHRVLRPKQVLPASLATNLTETPCKALQWDPPALNR